MPNTITYCMLYTHTHTQRRTQRWVSVTETVITPRKISIIPSQVLLTDRSKTLKESPHLGILRRYWRNRTRHRYEIVIRGSQWRRKGNSISRRIRDEEKIKNVGRIFMVVRNMSRVLHQLLLVMENSKVEN